MILNLSVPSRYHEWQTPDSSLYSSNTMGTGGVAWVVVSYGEFLNLFHLPCTGHLKITNFKPSQKLCAHSNGSQGTTTLPARQQLQRESVDNNPSEVHA